MTRYDITIYSYMISILNYSILTLQCQAVCIYSHAITFPWDIEPSWNFRLFYFTQTVIQILTFFVTASRVPYLYSSASTKRNMTPPKWFEPPMYGSRVLRLPLDHDASSGCYILDTYMYSSYTFCFHFHTLM